MPFFDGSVKKINRLDNIDRSSVCLTAVVIFARLRWWGKKMTDYVSGSGGTPPRQAAAQGQARGSPASLRRALPG